jgi:tRNA (uracil-5-)-methyltransferase TRM9
VKGTKELSTSVSPVPAADPQIFRRYYHMFARGELVGLVTKAASELGLCVGSRHDGPGNMRGLEIVQDGWERSNYYVELRCWERSLSTGSCSN